MTGGDGEWQGLADGRPAMQSSGMSPWAIPVAAIWLAAAWPAAAMEFCAGLAKPTCIIDGDTVRIDGEKIRLRDIDAPEPGGKCYRERDIAARSAERLRQLLATGPAAIERYGADRYGRTLADLTIAGADVGATLIAEGLARPQGIMVRLKVPRRAFWPAIKRAYSL
jgi:endonuclease YncB( thermonuclease family)